MNFNNKMLVRLASMMILKHSFIMKASSFMIRQYPKTLTLSSLSSSASSSSSSSSICSSSSSCLDIPTVVSELSPITYYTCRHTYESTLMEEIKKQKCLNSNQTIPKYSKISSPCPGLVRVENEESSSTYPHTYPYTDCLPDPIYALQILPWAEEIKAESINALAQNTMERLGIMTSSTNESFSNVFISHLQSSSRGSLTIHTIVPGMLKGTPKPQMERRVRSIGDIIIKQMKKSFPCARQYKENDHHNHHDHHDHDHHDNTDISKKDAWIMQLLLLSPTTLIASLSPVYQQSKIGNTWPCLSYTAGLASVEMPNDDNPSKKSTYTTTTNARGRGRDRDRDHDRDRGSSSGSGRDRYKPNTSTRTSTSTSNKLYKMKQTQLSTKKSIPIPSSAYRKLLEAISCMGIYPPSSTNIPIIDLGATPGGWTAALRRLGCQVISVDRANLASHLMKDPKVTFIKTDAFAFVPPPSSSSSSSWMVSDIIAFPERVTELLQEWCGNHMAERMIVTVKFKGESPNWDALKKAIDVAAQFGYDCRAKHFFNNKNEVTLMIALHPMSNNQNQNQNSNRSKDDWIMKSMFPLALTGQLL